MDPCSHWPPVMATFTCDDAWCLDGVGASWSLVLMKLSLRHSRKSVDSVDT